MLPCTEEDSTLALLDRRGPCSRWNLYWLALRRIWWQVWCENSCWISWVHLGITTYFWEMGDHLTGCLGLTSLCLSSISTHSSCSSAHTLKVSAVAHAENQQSGILFCTLCERNCSVESYEIRSQGSHSLWSITCQPPSWQSPMLPIVTNQLFLRVEDFWVASNHHMCFFSKLL